MQRTSTPRLGLDARLFLVFLVFLLPLVLCADEAPWVSHFRNGVAAREQGRFVEAKQLLETALAVSGFGAQDLRRACIADVLATVYAALGESGKARALYDGAQSVLESQPDADPTMAYAILFDVGTHRAAEGQLKEAEALLERAVSSGVRAFGERHASTATASSALAQVYTAQGRLSAAEPLLERAVEVHRSALKETSLERMGSETALGTLYSLQGRYERAQPILQRVNDAALKLGAGHPAYADSLVNLADLYRLEGNSARGEPLLRKALAIYEACIGPDSPRVANTLLDMSLDAIAQGKAALAERQISRALSILRRTSGPENTTVAVGEYRLAEAYGQLGRYAEARSLLEHALPIQERTYPGGHAVVADCLYGLAEVAVLQRHYPEAARYYERALALREHLGGPEGPRVASLLERYAKVLRTMRSAEANTIEARAREIRKVAASHR